MVFSWGHRTQRRITGTREVKGTLQPLLAARRRKSGLGPAVETESEPSLRLLALKCDGPLSHWRLAIADFRFGELLDQVQIIHIGTQCFRDHNGPIHLLIIFK